MKKKKVVKWVLFSLFLCLLDGMTKYLAITKLTSLSSSSSYPYGGVGIFQDFFGIDFCINRVINYGGAWGVFASYPRALLIIRVLVVLGGFIYVVFMNKDRKKDSPFLLVLTGAACNILNCFIYGAVIDMFHFTLWTYSFPVFNVADITIFFGVTILIFQSLVEKLNKQKTYETQSS